MVQLAREEVQRILLKREREAIEEREMLARELGEEMEEEERTRLLEVSQLSLYLFEDDEVDGED